ncbi:MAG: Heme A synthase [Phycisphaerae bacterium]|nr:Heme A synthase [Phycisphaerae bacterium]
MQQKLMDATTHETRDALPYVPRDAATTSLWLHRFTLVTLVATFVLIVAGGIVTTRDAGLAVPDWPLSFGKLMPERWYAIGNIAAEHTHRMIAGTVALLMLALAICVQLNERRGWVRGLAWVALAAVISQALLGGATVLVLGAARTYIRVFHAALAQTFFMLVMTLAAVTSRHWPARRASAATPSGALRAVCTLTAAVLFVQVMLGAVMRHTHSATALLEFPASFDGKLLPPADESALAALNEARFEAHELEAVTLPQVWANFAHRAFALLVAATVAGMAAYVLRHHRQNPRLAGPAVWLLVLLVVQVLLGALAVWSARNVLMTTKHVAVGVLMFALAFNLALRGWRVGRLPATAPQNAAAPPGWGVAST